MVGSRAAALWLKKKGTGSLCDFIGGLSQKDIMWRIIQLYDFAVRNLTAKLVDTLT
jgi:hypothetical protein